MTMTNEDILTYCPTCSRYKAGRYFRETRRTGKHWLDRCSDCHKAARAHNSRKRTAKYQANQ